MKRTLRHGLTLAVCLLTAAMGLWLYVDERDTRQQTHRVGDAATADRLDIDVSVQRVDPVARELLLRVLVQPRGALQEAGDQYTPTADLVIETSSRTQGTLRHKAGERISIEDIKVGLDGDGGVSDYPFDRYLTYVGFSAEAGGKPVPVSLNLRDVDPFFIPTIKEAEKGDGLAEFAVQIKRSRSTFIFAWFMMVIMWALSLAVLGTSWVIIDQRRGLVWPAMGWMAATLFALVGFRNAAPGSPPIGSILDYTAFLWAEGVISACLVAVALFGIRTERPTPEISV